MGRRVTSVATPVAHLVGPGALHVVNGQLAYTPEGDRPLRLMAQELSLLVLYGAVSVSDRAFPVLFQHDIEVAWLSAGGLRCRGRLVRSDPSRARLRLLQYRALLDGPTALEVARAVVVAKVRSQAAAARHYQRHGAASGPVLAQLAERERAAAQAVSLDELRGIEGAASAAWFRLLGEVLQPPWRFTQRVRRPPTDPVNALLSLGYTWLLTRTVARAEAAGLEVYLGALHDFHPGRPSLACDLMEPLRVPAVDRWVVQVCNGGRLAPDDFEAQDNGGIRLREGAFGRTLSEWESHWAQQKLWDDLERPVAELVSVLRRRGPALDGPEADGDL